MFIFFSILFYCSLAEVLFCYYRMYVNEIILGDKNENNLYTYAYPSDVSV